MLQTTTKRPPSLTLTGARIFKQRLANIRKNRMWSQEPGARVQWTKFSWKYDFPTFYEIILLLLYANKNLEFEISWEPYSNHDYKWSHFFSKSEIEVAFLRVLERNIFSILVARQIAAKWSRIFVQTSSKGQIKRETRPHWLTARIPFCFSYWSPPSSWEWPNFL